MHVCCMYMVIFQSARATTAASQRDMLAGGSRGALPCPVYLHVISQWVMWAVAVKCTGLASVVCEQNVF